MWKAVLLALLSALMLAGMFVVAGLSWDPGLKLIFIAAGIVVAMLSALTAVSIGEDHTSEGLSNLFGFLFVLSCGSLALSLGLAADGCQSSWVGIGLLASPFCLLVFGILTFASMENWDGG